MEVGIIAMVFGLIMFGIYQALHNEQEGPTEATVFGWSLRLLLRSAYT
jgi:hypothetical protein